MHKVKHLRREVQGDISITFCGLQMLKSQYLEQFDTDMPICKKCTDFQLAYDQRMEEEAERQIEAGVLEPNAPNRRWNEY